MSAMAHRRRRSAQPASDNVCAAECCCSTIVCLSPPPFFPTHPSFCHTSDCQSRKSCHQQQLPLFAGCNFLRRLRSFHLNLIIIAVVALQQFVDGNLCTSNADELLQCTSGCIRQRRTNGAMELRKHDGAETKNAKIRTSIWMNWIEQIGSVSRLFPTHQIPAQFCSPNPQCSMPAERVLRLCQQWNNRWETISSATECPSSCATCKAHRQQQSDQ